MQWKFFILAALAGSVFADPAITPEHVLSQEEISEITGTQNYFLYKSLDDGRPVWMHTHRHYGQHLFNHRDHIFTLEDVLHHVLTDAFPIQEKIQELYRGRLGIHVQLGNILPQLIVDFGQGLSPHGINQALTGLYSFLLPANWMQLVNKKRVYRTTQLMLAKVTLDQLLSARTIFLQQHQRIQEFEILNYYFIHLQLLAGKYPELSRKVQTILGKFAALGTDMSIKRSEIRLGFETLALVMALAKVDHHAGTGHLNIADIEDFPDHVLDLEQLEDVYQHKSEFIKAVIRNSLELKIFMQFYKISRLNIGISAFGAISTVEDAKKTDSDVRFAMQFGYGNLPMIMIARSLAKTVRIDVQKQYVDMLSIARESFDYHLNSIGNYAEAKRALAMNRAAFKTNVQYLVDSGAEPDALFMLALDQLIQSELKLNQALHLSLIARAYMDRFLLREKSDVFKHLPNKGDILKQFAKIKGEKLDELKREEEISKVFEGVRNTRELDRLLNHSVSDPLLSTLSEKELIQAVQNSMGILLYSKVGFRKHRSFYKILDAFVAKHKIQLTQMEAYILLKKQTSWWHRMFSRAYLVDEKTLYSLDFDHFGDRPE